MQIFIKILCLLLFVNCYYQFFKINFCKLLFGTTSFCFRFYESSLWAGVIRWSGCGGGGLRIQGNGSCYGQSSLVLKVVGLVEQKRLVTRSINFKTYFYVRDYEQNTKPNMREFLPLFITKGASCEPPQQEDRSIRRGGGGGGLG